MSGPAILSAEGLGYRYPGGTDPVLHGLDFEIGEGEIFGFLGPNGSGKTTTQKLLTRILLGYSGGVEVFGRDLASQGSDYYQRIGVQFELPNLYEKLTAEENLEFYRGFFSGPTEDVAGLLERLDLPAGDRRSAGELSKGMKIRLVLARSLLNRPRLWFLDEPTGGQDPRHAVAIRELIRERAASGTSIFLTTHDMAVAERLCDRVAFLVDGRIALVDRPERLIRERSHRRVRVEVARGGTIEMREFDLDDPASREALAECVRGERVETIHSVEPTLEDVFLAVTGRGLDAS